MATNFPGERAFSGDVHARSESRVYMKQALLPEG